MNAVASYFRELPRAAADGWNRFWFRPADPATLALIRILAGLMLLYSHAVWTLALDEFFGPTPWQSHAAVTAFDRAMAGPLDGLQGGAAQGSRGQARTEENGASEGLIYRSSYSWSYFDFIDAPPLLYVAHAAALVVFALLTVGLFSRVTSVLAFLIAVSYVNRVPGATFGFDDTIVMLAMYLMVGPCGAAWSVDSWLKRRRVNASRPTNESRRAGGDNPSAPFRVTHASPLSVSANVAIRLIQLHMCVIYLFAGLGKLQGAAWWNGTALWLAFANAEYQTLDMTWLADHMLVVALMTHVTVFWEISFSALVWPRLTRPLVLALALPLHLGIGICLGMMTFGLAMLIGCLAFVPPSLVRGLFGSAGRVFAERSSAADG